MGWAEGWGDGGAGRGGQGCGLIHQTAASGALPPMTQRNTADPELGGLYGGAPEQAAGASERPGSGGGTFPQGAIVGLTAGGIHSPSGETLLEGEGEWDWQQGLRLDTNTRICDDVHWCFLFTSKRHPCRTTRLQTGATDVGSAGCEPGRQQQSGPPLGIGRPFLASGPFCMFLGMSRCFHAGQQGELATSVSAPTTVTVTLCQGRPLGSSDPPGRGMSPWWPGLRLCTWQYFKLPRMAEAFAMTPPGAGPTSGRPCQHSPESPRTGRFNMPDTQQVLNKCAWKRPSQGTFRSAVNSSIGMELSRESLQVPVCLQGDLGQIT